ncbi:restriction endonuclease subunit S [Peribacillus sp. B2I2]|uniref:restriction endonuclease subunit S n=1 Tax=Peribacillus sp. B2I2 TaxID=3156468 RepID=UPI0035191690
MSKWQKIKLGEILSLTSGKSKTKQNLHQFSEPFQVPVYGGNGINGYTDKSLVNERVIVIGRVGEYCGSVYLTEDMSWITDNALYTKSVTKGTNLKYLYYLLSYSDLGRLRSQSGQPQVSQKPIYELEVDFAPKEDQFKIASILSSVDEAIEKTQAVIEQMGKVKKGLMQQLLTRGIGHTKFKKTEIGEIPEVWEIVSLGNVAKVQGGYAFKSSDAKQEGIRWLKIANVGIGDIKWGEESFLPEKYEEKYNEYVLKEDDIVMAMTRPILNNELKIAVIKSSDIPALLNQRVCRFHLTSMIDRQFFYQLARNSFFVKEIQLKIMGTDPPNVSSKQIEDIQIPLPPITEQVQIANILKEIDKKANKEARCVKYLQDMKKGLMQSLLTGKVRVKVDEAEVTQV